MGDTATGSWGSRELTGFMRREQVRQEREQEGTMKTYQVRLNIPTAMWALVEIDADSEEEAAKKALEANAAGTVSYEFAGFDNADAEVLEVEEIETAGVRKGGYDENC